MRQHLIALLCLLGIAIPTLADNVITVSSASGQPGDEVEVTLSLQNTEDIVAAEVRIALDKYVQYVSGSAVLNEARADGHQLSTASVADELRLYVYNYGHNALKGSSGNLVTFRLRLGRNPEILTLTPRVILSDSRGQTLHASTNNGQVTILAPQLTVLTPSTDFGHIPIRSSYTRNLTLQNSGTSLLSVSGITFSAGEFSIVGQSSFDIAPGATKSVTVAYLPTRHGATSATMTIISDAVNGKQTAALVADPYSVNELHIGNASGMSDGEVTVAVTMNNMEPIVAGQWSFTLPNALTYVKGSLATSEHASALSANTTVVGQKLTCFVYSTNNARIDEGDGVIATFRLRLQGSTGTYSLNPTEVVLSNAKLENMVSATSSGRVSIQSPTISCDAGANFGDIPVAAESIRTFVIRNTGRAQMEISRVTFLAEGFSVAEAMPLIIAPNGSQSITIKYLPALEGTFATSMNIYSNDPVNRMKTVAVKGKAYEANSLSLEGQLHDDESYTLDISMTNYSEIVALQMDVRLPEGLELADTHIIPASRLEGLSSIVAPMEGGVYRIAIYSLNNRSVSGNDGALFALRTSGDVRGLQGKVVSVENIVLSNQNGKNYSLTQSLNFEIPRYPYLGDADGDDVVNILDVLATLSIIKGGTGDFDQNAADANKDVRVDILDVLKILEFIKQK